MMSENSPLSPCLEPAPYFKSSKFPLSDVLAEETTCEVCVVGAGVSGLCVAYELASRGHRVIVVDGDELGRGETARSTAHLVTALDERYFVLEEQYGRAVTAAAATAHARGIDWIEEVVARHQIDCGFCRVPGTLVVPRHRAEDAESLISREHAAAARAGIACESLDSCHVPGGCRSAALQFPRQAQLQPVALLAGLAHAIQKAGGLVVTNHPVTDIRASRTPLQCTAGGKLIQARHMVIASHAIPESLRPRLRKVRSVVSYVMVYSTHKRDMGLTPSLLWDGYWDDDTPYHYVRIDDATDSIEAGPQRIVVGGEDHEGECAIDAAAAYARLDRWTREHFTCVDKSLHQWWGRIAEPEGEFALIGSVPGAPGLYIVAGDSGNGMTYGAIAARRVTAMIEDQPAVEIEDAIFNPASVIPGTSAH